MGVGPFTPRRASAALVVLLALAIWCAPALARTVHYRGLRIEVPSSWPVFDLATRPSTCVRFNRHALYLGSPGAEQRCPADAAGRTEAILVAPISQGASAAAASSTLASALPATSATAEPAGGSEGQLMLPADGVVVTATWRQRPHLVSAALGVRRLPAITAAGGAPAPLASAAQAGAGAVYKGLGFDPCEAPTTSQMRAWRSAYRATGIYIGGTNEGCSQSTLTPSWVRREAGAGWRLIPTYVGLQAPSNSCGCAAIRPSHAAAEGRAAAVDAINRAAALGLGAGNPIYFDMEAYSTGGQSTSAVLKFLAAWTSRLHAGGYVSGVYSSGGSGIADLVARYGTSYLEPDDIWVADWNGRRSTADPYVPSADWASAQRLHQYSGAHNETHGGVTLNIDGDYLDGSTAGTASVTPAPAPKLAVRPQVDGTVVLHASWPGSTSVAAWQVLAGETRTSLAALGAPFKRGDDANLRVHSEFPYFAVQALDSSGADLASTRPLATKPRLTIYGRTAFVARGHGGIPAGCFTGSSCEVRTKILSAGKVIGSSRPRFIGDEGGRILSFKLNGAGRSQLAGARGHHLPVVVQLSDASGVTASETVNLVSYRTHGAAPGETLTQAPGLRLIGATDFVYHGSTGGILAACTTTAPCMVKTAIVAGGQTVATAGPQFTGAHELVYLRFKLTTAGRRMLARAHGNQLGVQLTIEDGVDTASGRAVLVSFG